MSPVSTAAPSAEGVASRVADMAVTRDASSLRVSRAADSYGATTFVGKSRTSAGDRAETGLADDLDALLADVGEVRVETPSNPRIQAVRIERVADEVAVTLIPRTLFDFPIRGARAA